MPQQDKEITEILGIPRLTLHSWKTGSSHTRLLYSILKRMSASELRAKKEDAQEFFNLLVIDREELYQRLYHHESLHRPMDGYEHVKLINNINIGNKDDMACLREPADNDKSLIVHYIVKGSHNKATAKAFIKKIQDLFSSENGVDFNGIEIHLYGTDLKEDIYLANAMSGRIVKTHNINEVLGIDKELVVISNTL
ncbi:MAG: hypothetical protein DRQ78_04415 [Epsilonproteobacteria bacterium]|nr:MAG: hypothetical protein DRQ78_04415 [Campylobacterota bacterium]